jgi:hypothetical protein
MAYLVKSIRLLMNSQAQRSLVALRVIAISGYHHDQKMGDAA